MTIPVVSVAVAQTAAAGGVLVVDGAEVPGVGAVGPGVEAGARLEGRGADTAARQRAGRAHTRPTAGGRAGRVVAACHVVCCRARAVASQSRGPSPGGFASSS